MNESIQRLRSQARRLARGKGPTSVRYPESFHTAAVAFARSHLERGASVTRVARELGLSPWSLARWLQRKPRAGLLPVTIAPDSARAPRPVASAVLITPRGVRVEGLDRESLIVVLRALA
jgi:transposase